MTTLPIRCLRHADNIPDVAVQSAMSDAQKLHPCANLCEIYSRAFLLTRPQQRVYKAACITTLMFFPSIPELYHETHHNKYTRHNPGDVLQQDTRPPTLAMKVAIIVAALLGLTAAMPASGPPPNDSTFDIDLTDLADAVNELEAGDGIFKRGNCPSQQTCVGHRCVRLQCQPIPRGSTQCITFKYGNC